MSLCQTKYSLSGLTSLCSYFDLAGIQSTTFPTLGKHCFWDKLEISEVGRSEIDNQLDAYIYNAYKGIWTVYEITCNIQNEGVKDAIKNSFSIHGLGLGIYSQFHKML